MEQLAVSSDEETNFESLTRWLETNGPPKLSAGAREERLGDNLNSCVCHGVMEMHDVD